MYIYIYIYIYLYVDMHMCIYVITGRRVLECRVRDPVSCEHLREQTSGGRLCTLIGVPCRISMLSTFSTFANILF